MVIKKTYDKNNYIVLNVKNKFNYKDKLILEGVLLDYKSEYFNGLYKIGEDYRCFMSDLVEVLEL